MVILIYVRCVGTHESDKFISNHKFGGRRAMERTSGVFKTESTQVLYKFSCKISNKLLNLCGSWTIF